MTLPLASWTLVDEGRGVTQAGGEHRHLHAGDRVDLILRREARGADIGPRGLDVGQVEIGADAADHLLVVIRQEVARVRRSLTPARTRRDVGGDEDVDAEGTVGEVLNVADLRFEAVGRESGCAEHAESAGVGDCSDEFGSGDAALSAADGRSHACQGDGVFDVQEVAHLGVEDRSGHSAPVNRGNAEVMDCIVPASMHVVNLWRVSRVLPSTGRVGSKMSACGYV